MRALAISAAALVALPFSAQAADHAWPVVRVIDGNTIVVDDGRHAGGDRRAAGAPARRGRSGEAMNAGRMAFVARGRPAAHDGDVTSDDRPHAPTQLSDQLDSATAGG